MPWYLAMLVYMPYWATLEIEKTAVLIDKGIELHWYPKMPAIKGWVRDHTMDGEDISVLIPKGTTFKDAGSIIYGRADYIPRMEKGVTLDKVIARDYAGMKKHYPRVRVTKLSDMHTASGKPMKSFLYEYDPTRDITHDKVAFCKEGDFFIVLSISSKTEADFKKDVATFDREVAAYR